MTPNLPAACAASGASRRACLLLLGLALTGPLSAAESPRFLAGAATGDITPELGAMIVGGFSPVPAKSVHDPLQVRALVLDDGVRPVALVVCDNVGLPREVCDEARRRATAATGIDGAGILIASTHTHSGITAGTETSIGPNLGRNPADLAAYQALVASRVAATVRLAQSRLEPARIGWGRAAEPRQVFNRRWHVSDEALRRNPFGGVDAVRMNPPAGSPALVRPAGPTDPDISFLSVQAADGRPLALFASYSLHYVGGVGAGEISADYFAVFCARIGELLQAGRPRDAQAPPFVGLLANGSSGDVNNVNFRVRAAARPRYELMREVAFQVAAAVHEAQRSVVYRDAAELGARLEDLPLQSRRPAPEMIARAQALVAAPAEARPAWHPLERFYANRVLQRAAAPAEVSAPLQAVRIGEVLLLTVPGEPFAETGLELKAKSPLPLTMVLGLTNGYYGYLPPPTQIRLGGYETWVGTNRLEPEAVPKMSAVLRRLGAELAGRPDARR
jgi:neutral ceramidase